MPLVLLSDGLDATAALDWAREVAGSIAAVRELTGGWTSTLLALTRDRGDQLVLRLMTNEPWRTHGAALTTRESDIQRMLVTTSVPAPLSVALDAEGARCGVPAHLMTLLPGHPDDSADDHVLTGLADLLATIHQVIPTIEVREYQSWAWEPKFNPPPWSQDPGLWSDAFALLRTEPPAYQPCFLHRDYQPRNVLWSTGAVSGVVDWVETSIGPAWLDVAHCATNLALVHGNEAAERFAQLYAERTGREPQPYFDVMDVVGFLPLPGQQTLGGLDRGSTRRWEDRLRLVLSRC